MNLTEFLIARITEDEEAIRGLFDQDRPGMGRLGEALQQARTGQLADIAAKRRLIDPVVPDDWSEIAASYPIAHQAALALLALPYEGHGDYREEWHP